MTARNVVMGLTAIAVVALSQPGIAQVERPTIFQTLDRLEVERDQSQQAASMLQGEVETLDAELIERESRIDVARRAAGPIHRQVARSLTVWTRVMNSVQTSQGRVDQRGDTLRLLKYAAPKGIAPALTDVDVLRHVDGERRALDARFADRVSMSITLAQHRATAETREKEKEHTLKKAARDPAIRDEIKASDESLHRSLSHLMKNQTTRDFHRLKGTLIPPVSGDPRHRFGQRAQTSTVSTRHTGLTWVVKPGTPVKSTAGGLVVYAHRFEGFGNMVIIDHGGGYHSLYAHLAEINVAMGNAVVRGKTLGTTGETGSLEGPKLYFELRKDGRAIDPMPWFVRRN